MDKGGQQRIRRNDGCQERALLRNDSWRGLIKKAENCSVFELGRGFGKLPLAHPGRLWIELMNCFLRLNGYLVPNKRLRYSNGVEVLEHFRCATEIEVVISYRIVVLVKKPDEQVHELDVVIAKAAKERFECIRIICVDHLKHGRL